MLFFFKKPSVVVDCFTSLRGVYELYKPSKSIEFYPEEFTKMKSYFMAEDKQLNISHKMGTIKRCIAIQDYFKHGFILPMWTDFICQPKPFIDGDSALGMIGGQFKFNSHFSQQWNETGLFTDYLHVKLISPWSFREKTGVKFSWNQATWNLSKHIKDFTVVPGVISYDLNTATHVNLFVDKNVERFELLAGTPLVHMCAFSDKEVTLKHHLVDEKEIQKLGIPDDFSWQTPNRYLKYKKMMENEKTKKCPFGFGK